MAPGPKYLDGCSACLGFRLLFFPGPQTFGQRLYQQYTCYTVFFISIEMCQIADVLIRKTRRLSAFQQGFFRSLSGPALSHCAFLNPIRS